MFLLEMKCNFSKRSWMRIFSLPDQTRMNALEYWSENLTDQTGSLETKMKFLYFGINETLKNQTRITP